MSKLDELSQKAATPEEAIAEQIDARLKDVHTCLPAIIESFDPATQTASVQPAIKRIFTEKGAVNLPLCVDVPVAFPGGGNWFLTFPVKAGDECILMFSERAIDLWHVAGSTQSPAEYRLHDLSDGIAIVGLNSQPRKIENFRDDATQLRNRTGDHYIELSDDGKAIVHAADVKVMASHSYSWDVAGFGERWTHVGGSTWNHHTWQQGATITNTVNSINPPEGY